MLVLLGLVLLIALVAIMARGFTAGPLNTAERIYLVAAPIPAVLAFVAPGPINLLMQGSAGARAWGVWLTKVGGWLSLALILVGTLLLVRRSGRRLQWDRRLLAGLMVAALPVVLMALVALMYAF